MSKHVLHIFWKIFFEKFKMKCLYVDFYHPQPKDGEGTVFTGVCLSTGVGVLGSMVSGPRSFPRGLPWSLVPGDVLSGGGGPGCTLSWW